MNQYSGILICCDCDGTLTDSSGRLSAENARAIRRFQQNGGLFTMATGRFPDFLVKFRPELVPNAPVIAINGTMIYDTAAERVLFEQPLPQDADQVLDYVAEHYPQVNEVRLVHSVREPIYYRRGITPGLKELYPTVPRPWYKFVFCQPEEDTLRLKADLQQRFGHRFLFDRSWPEGLEMHDRGTGKGACIQRLKQLIDTPVHTTVCIGDFENDITMLQAADISYAVENAIPEVKRAAGRVTVSNNQHAIAKVISEL